MDMAHENNKAMAGLPARQLCMYGYVIPVFFDTVTLV